MFEKLKIVLDIKDKNIDILDLFESDRILKTFEDEEIYDEEITLEKIKKEYPLVDNDDKVYYYIIENDKYDITLNFNTIHIYIKNKIEKQEFLNIIENISCPIRIAFQMNGVLNREILMTIYSKLRKNYYMTLTFNTYNNDDLEVNSLQEGLELFNDQYKKVFILEADELKDIIIDDINYTSMILETESKEFKSDIIYELEYLFNEGKIKDKKLSDFRKYLIDE